MMSLRLALVGALLVGRTQGSCQDDFNAYNAAASAAMGASAGVCKHPETPELVALWERACGPAWDELKAVYEKVRECYYHVKST